MSQKIAIAIIHGAGSQGPDFAQGIIAKLTAAFARHLPEADKSVPDKLAFVPIYWAGILARKQRILWNIVEDDAQLDFKIIRKFFMDFGGDAIAYQPGATRRQVYNQIHQTVTTALSQLAVQAGPKAPLCIIGHSIGTIIIHNYFFDMAQAITTDTLHPTANTPLEKGETLAMFFMMGSPLAIWSLRYNDYQPIPFPGRQVPDFYPNLNPKWINYYDKDDILAYPIRSLSKGHQDLAAKGILQDIQVDAGNILTSWNPMSHTGYWQDNNVIEPIAQHLFEVWRAINQ